jgi:hypothetical protein
VCRTSALSSSGETSGVGSGDCPSSSRLPFVPVDFPSEVAQECALCGDNFCVHGVYARAGDGDMMIDDANPAACSGCVAYFGDRDPERFPTLAEYLAAERLYPKPILSGIEEMGRVEEEGRFGEVLAAARLCRDDLIVR